MSDNTMKDDLKDAGDHVKEALRASLIAARKAIDLAIDKLGDDEPARPQGDPAERMTPDDQPPPAPPDV